MLKKLHLENFKSWENLDLELSNLTFLFGTNSSGKTSILSSLLLLKQTATGFDRFQPINLGGSESDYVDFGSYKNLVFSHDETRNVGIRLEWIPEPGMVISTGVPTIGNSIVAVGELGYTITWQQRSEHVLVDRLEYDVLEPTPSDYFVRVKWD